MNSLKDLMDFLATLKSKNKAELEGALRQWQVNARIWVQENGEKALGVGLVAGLLVAIAFKVVLAVALLAVLSAFVIWFLAPEEDPSSSLPPSSSEGTASSNGSSSQENGGAESMSEQQESK